MARTGSYLPVNACGQDITADSTFRMLSYSGSGTCYWRIKSPNNGRIRVQIRSLRYACALSCEQFVEFKYGLSLAATGVRMCCSPTVTQFLSDGHYVIIISTASQASQFVIQYRNGRNNGPSKISTTPSGYSICWKVVRLGRLVCVHRKVWRMREEEEEEEEHEEETHLGHSATSFMTAIRQKRNANYWCCERYLARGSVCVHV
ncbi:unnamed protein product, partial [Mesorhabditis spiculigera]